MTVTIRTAVREDLDRIIAFIRALADYEKLADEVVLDRTTLDSHLFGSRPMAEVLIAELNGEPSVSRVWNGRCSTGTNRRSVSTSRSGQPRWTAGPSTASMVQRS